MATLLLALITVSLATLGGRDSARVAGLSAGLGRGLPLLVAAWLACASTGLLAAWLGAVLTAELSHESQAALVCLALGLAAAALLALRPGRVPDEPTRSFGAVLLVLGAAQLAGPIGLLVFALSAVTGLPTLAGAGGALGSGAVLTAAWASGIGWERRMPLRSVRFAVAGLLLVAALATVLPARLLP